jgi:hypothetical protein
VTPHKPKKEPGGWGEGLVRLVHLNTALQLSDRGLIKIKAPLLQSPRKGLSCCLYINVLSHLTHRNRLVYQIPYQLRDLYPNMPLDEGEFYSFCLGAIYRPGGEESQSPGFRFCALGGEVSGAPYGIKAAGASRQGAMGEPAQQAGRQGQDEFRQEIGSDERRRQAQENQEKEPYLLPGIWW